MKALAKTAGTVTIRLEGPADLAGWRAAARRLFAEGVPPGHVIWLDGAADDLFAQDAAAATQPTTRTGLSVPRAFLELADTVGLAAEPERFALLYRLLWRIGRGERELMDRIADPDRHRAEMLAKTVRREIHKMRAFVRFRELADAEGTRFVAWFEPAHYVVEANADFFARRFANMDWSILTPYRSLHWRAGTSGGGGVLAFGPGTTPAEAPAGDALETYWRAYYASIFNPARLNIRAMTAEMPRRFWRNLPEAQEISSLVAAAEQRTRSMIQARPDPTLRARCKPPASSPVFSSAGKAAARAETLPDLAARAAACRACPLWADATQTVFGEGASRADIMLVGEQPGDQEDLAGHPFVGPAGKLLDRVLAEAGIDRGVLYVTNAVKHFKFEPRGKRRIHQKPNGGEIAACRPWIGRERALVRPKLTVLLGATAAQSLFGRPVTIGRERGRVQRWPDGGAVLVTVHPSYLLRIPPADQAAAFSAFVEDLRRAAQAV